MGKDVPLKGVSTVMFLVIPVLVGLHVRKSKQNLILPLFKKKKIKNYEKYIVNGICELSGKPALSSPSHLGGAM